MCIILSQTVSSLLVLFNQKVRRTRRRVKCNSVPGHNSKHKLLSLLLLRGITRITGVVGLRTSLQNNVQGELVTSPLSTNGYYLIWARILNNANVADCFIVGSDGSAWVHIYLSWPKSDMELFSTQSTNAHICHRFNWWSVATRQFKN